MALVVFPVASSESIILRAFGSRCDSSPIPFALSAIGPKASIATLLPVNVSIPIPVIAIP